MTQALLQVQIYQCLSQDPYPIEERKLELISWRRHPAWGFDCCKHWWDIREIQTQQSVMMQLKLETRQCLEAVITQFEDSVFDDNPTPANPFRQLILAI